MAYGLKDLADSERGVFSIALVICVTILAALKIITGAEWLAFVQWVSVALIAGKTVTTAVGTVVNGRKSRAAPTRAPE